MKVSKVSFLLDRQAQQIFTPITSIMCLQGPPRPPCFAVRSTRRLPIACSSYRSELSYPCPTHTGRVRPLQGVSRTCVEAALKTSSTLVSIEELRKRLVSAKAPQRSFLLHHGSADRANLSRSYGATGKAWAQQRSILPLRYTLSFRPSHSLASGTRCVNSGPTWQGTSNTTPETHSRQVLA